MRMTWARKKTSPQARADRMHFVMWDFLRMFLAAVICGLAVSVIAAAIALVLARDAYAAAPIKVSVDTDIADAFQPFPGMLLVGRGCDAETVDATERDWKVTIIGEHIDVRVMQTFLVPDGDTASVTFSALLPTGARLLRLSAHTIGSLWQGRAFDADSYAQLTAADFRDLSRKGILIVQNEDGDISTDAIINIAATETVTVEYTYRIRTDESPGSHALMIALGNDSYPAIQANDKTAASGTVWVEWIGKKPVQLVRMPSNATLETASRQITGLSWDAGQLDANARFQLAWVL